ncbi:metal ABC transporter permease [Agrococcus sp. HG114]|uniref:metal ABC transporter permease n=1 Tax=Agrococcus sp. HG114 TaxID=2969757 RepID=UPI00215A3C85|nr:metal ABC transporter permease [Agrococcus sp. HG114]MCR8671737.1 metal ABC transporter permease [Agrococcus sp. HG114]
MTALAALVDPVTPFAAPFLARPLVLLVALAGAAGTVGVLVHVRRLEFSTDGLTHAVFPGLAIGAMLGGAAGLLPGAIGAALVAAVVLALISRRGQARDTAVAIVLTSFFSLGVVLVSASDGIAGSLSDFFFGRLLTITWSDLWVALALIGIAVALIVATAGQQLYAAFDPVGARRAGLNVLALEVVGNVAVALVVVAASASVGTLLALAVVIVPTAAARALTRSLVAAGVLSALFGALTGWLGLWLVVQLAALGLDAAPGATVALTMIVGYLVALAAGAVRTRVARPRRRGRDLAAAPLARTAAASVPRSHEPVPGTRADAAR